MTRRKRPDGLGSAGGALWRSVLATYVLSPAEAATLERACRTLDLMARIDGELAAGGVSVEGSMGQVRAHPLIAVQADLSRVLNIQLMSLALPMPDEDVGRRRSPQQQEAAQARWRGQRDG
jgi:hypothetical protein